LIEKCVDSLMRGSDDKKEVDKGNLYYTSLKYKSMPRQYKSIQVHYTL
jgi:hypothetical protein